MQVVLLQPFTLALIGSLWVAAVYLFARLFALMDHHSRILRRTPVQYLLLVGVAGITNASLGQSTQWIRQFGTAGDDHATAITFGVQGDAVVGGYAYGPLCGPHLGGVDCWLRRFDSAGNAMWSSQFGTSANDNIWAIASKGTAGFWTGGHTQGSLGGPLAGAADGWIACYDWNGNQVWLRQFGSTGEDVLYDICPAGNGGAFATGSTSGAFGGPSAGLRDFWIARIDDAGSFVWVRQYGTNQSDDPLAIVPDAAGGVFVCGHIQRTSGTDWKDGWLARFDGAGNQLWFRIINSGALDWAYDAAPDGSGGVYVCGETEGSLGVPAGFKDGWVARYDAGGNRLWVTQLGSPEAETFSAIATTRNGTILVGGTSYGPFGGAPLGIGDACVAHLDGNGHLISAMRFGSADSDQLSELAVDAQDRMIAIGSTTGNFAAPPAGAYDPWVAAFDITCYANCDDSGFHPFLNVNDFVCFLNRFNSGDPYANCDASTAPPVLTVNDFVCFLSRYAAQCF